MAQKLEILPDDMSITRGLLENPDFPPRRRTSFTSSAKSANTQDISNKLEETTRIKEDSRRRRMIQSSNTWTTSSGEILSEQDEIEERTFFILEYNRLATKHGVRTLILEGSDSSNLDSGNASKHSGSWFSRKILRRTSSSQSFKHKNDRVTKHRRSISDLSLRLKSKNNTLKDKDLQELVRLCGLSLLYLPTEYAANSLAVPTCFRATAQYLVQHASTARGVFRVPGSHSTVAALYNHYCTTDEHGAVVSGTVRCPTLPDHIRCDVHDVASAFKKFISGLPGGILGSLSLFDAFISIQSQFNGAPELTRTKQSKVRARLIALAISTARFQYRRELICAVFGLLSMIGRTAEMAPRENNRGQPLPTSDLMGYGPLGIVFGPLLVGDLLDNYTMLIPNPRGGLVLLPIRSPKSRKERNKKNKTSEDCSAFNTHVDKIRVANSITEMLITNWRDVVRHMKNMKALKTVSSYKSLDAAAPKQPLLRPSASESFALRKPPDWDSENSPMRQIERCESPTPVGRGGGVLGGRLSGPLSPRSNEMLTVRKHKSRPRATSNQMLSGTRSMSILSPTKEENPAECSPGSAWPPAQKRSSTTPTELCKEAPETSEVAQIGSSKPLGRKVSPLGISCKKVYPVSENPESSNHEAFLKLENIVVQHTDGSSPDREHPLIHCPPMERKDCAPTKNPNLQILPVRGHHLEHSSPPPNFQASAPSSNPKYLLKQTRLVGRREPKPSGTRISHPDITQSIVPSSGLPMPTVNASRRPSASEPRIRPNVTNVRPVRHSKSTFVETDRRNAAENWRTSTDPMARVSVAEDLASLAALAHALKEEPAKTNFNSSTSGKDLLRQNVDCGLPKLIRKLGETDTRRALAKQESEFARLAREAACGFDGGSLDKVKYDNLVQCIGELAPKESSLNTKDSRPVQKSLERPSSIYGSTYGHLSRRTSNPKESPGKSLGLSGSPTLVKQQTPVGLSTNRVSVEAQVENNQKRTSDIPRLSVRALTAKFNNGEAGPISTPSPTEPLSKPTSIDIGGDSQEKIIAPYRINPPSPAKSSISNVSIHSARAPPSADQIVLIVSPLRKSLRYDLSYSTPLRTVTRRESLLLPLDPPACCSPAGSPQRLSLFDGPSVQPSPCLASSHVDLEPKEALVSLETAIATNKTPSISVAINPLMSPPPTRSNSLLHVQIRNLQQQLSSKMEEVRHLKRQLGSRATLDIGALSEELREAKKEIQVWKNRVEVAEKQLQVMATLSARNSSHNATSSSPLTVGNFVSTPSRANCREDGAKVSIGLRRASHGLDGTSSLPGSSECSTGTVVRDDRSEELATERDHSMWVHEAVKRL